jgi:hypothetical protein
MWQEFLVINFDPKCSGEYLGLEERDGRGMEKAT